jgi:hypothetical protein
VGYNHRRVGLRALAGPRLKLTTTALGQPLTSGARTRAETGQNS